MNGGRETEIALSGAMYGVLFFRGHVNTQTRTEEGFVREKLIMGQFPRNKNEDFFTRY